MVVPPDQEEPGKSWSAMRHHVTHWSGSRTYVAAVTIVFGLLYLGGAIHVAAALAAYGFILIVVLARGAIAGDSRPVRVSRASGEKRATPLGGGPSLTILDRLPDPLIVLDGAGRVLLRNSAAEPLVVKQAVGKHVATVLRNAPLISCIESVLKGGPACSVEYTLPVPVERHFNAFVTPIETEGEGPGPRKNFLVLVLLHDLTEAKRVESMRVDFVANASHELKTPLASLSGFIDTLSGHAKDDPDAREKFLGIMSDQAQRMRRLIDDLLSLSRIELREHVLPDQLVNLQGVVEDVMDALTPIARDSGVELVASAPATLPPVRGERDELAQIIQNLVDNALRYAQSGKRIEIGLSRETRGSRDVVRLAVRDFGPGIAREHIPRLTERFYRVDAATSRARGGTGLGLAIVKHIVNRHQGTLAIESEIGKGTTFVVQIPVAETGRGATIGPAGETDDAAAQNDASASVRAAQ
ncbi:two-component system phosphate regulon sensor histidine kinase PhoR [Parvibaculum indicum]|uniref:ATP-binding protein n=1 Tax=Parvibaculum indicum TaxID=562969 RepID=UPI0014236216|nr:two-component system phosphate regulon sensor histidine kinase PhoR [Parvibaculum indicum]